MGFLAGRTRSTLGSLSEANYERCGWEAADARTNDMRGPAVYTSTPASASQPFIGSGGAPSYSARTARRMSALPSSVTSSRR